MAHDVFISHSSNDKTVADAVCAKLESHNIRCWIAPRDIQEGVSYPGQIIQGIRNCRVMVLIFSSHANDSEHVFREVERAANYRKLILPFRIEDILPSADMEYFLATPHWLDAITPPMEQHIDVLPIRVKALLKSFAPSSPESVSLPPDVNPPAIAIKANHTPETPPVEEAKSPIESEAGKSEESPAIIGETVPVISSAEERPQTDREPLPSPIPSQPEISPRRNPRIPYLVATALALFAVIGAALYGTTRSNSNVSIPKIAPRIPSATKSGTPSKGKIPPPTNPHPQMTAKKPSPAHKPSEKVAHNTPVISLRPARKHNRITHKLAHVPEHRHYGYSHPVSATTHKRVKPHPTPHRKSDEEAIRHAVQEEERASDGGK